METDARRGRLSRMVRMAVCTALLCVSAYLSVPVPFASAMVTALTVVMNFTAFVLPPKETFGVILLYTLLGTAGLPVFVGGAAGVGELFGPRGGFLFSFLVAYPLVSAWKGGAPSIRRYAAAAILAGLPVTYLGGLLGLMLATGLPIREAAFAAVLPFIPGDVLKALLAAWLAVRLRRAMPEHMG